MEKKKKRASFSVPPSKIEPKKAQTRDGGTSSRQVVEVVVGEKKAKQEDITPVAEVNIVLPEAGGEEGIRIRNIDMSEVEKSRLEENIFGEDEEEETNKGAESIKAKKVLVKKDEEEENEKDTEGEEEVEEKTEKNDTSTYQEVVVVDDEEAAEEEEDEREEEKEEEEEENASQAEHLQSSDKEKETVAELFSKGSDGTLPEITVHKAKHTRTIIMWAILMITIAVTVGGGLIFFTSRSNQLPQSPLGGGNPTPIPTALPTPIPSPTPQPIDKKSLKVQVQNGGGKVGAASKMKALLEEKGYTVSEVGNADSYTYETTEISAKASASGILTVMQTDLEGTYKPTVGKDVLSDSEKFDVRVIVGKE